MKQREKQLQVFLQQKLQQLRIKQQQLNKYRAEKQRILNERVKIQQKRDQLRMKIQEIREKNQYLRNQQLERSNSLIISIDEQYQYRMMNMDYLRNMVIGMRYQNGMDIDPDNMTYQQLLQLQQKIGNVSKGLTPHQISLLPRRIFNQGSDKQQLCSICYYNVKDEEQLLILPCRHLYHSECIKEWLGKEKMCPMCKQEIEVEGASQQQRSGQCQEEQQDDQNYQDQNQINHNQDDQARLESMYQQEDYLSNQINHQHDNINNINIDLNVNSILQGELEFTEEEGFKQIDLNDE